MSALLRRQFRVAHAFLDAAIDWPTGDALHRYPTGTTAQAGATFAQAVLCEDLSVNGVLTVGTPLAFSTWAGRTGISEMPPLRGQIDWSAWARRVRLDLAELRPYARAVHAATDAYLAGLPDRALDPTNGELHSCVLSALLLTLSKGRGEIACLLGIEGRPAADEMRG